jgi:hypothetical protein
MGAFTFAFLLGETVHEFGHFLAHRAYGHLTVRVHLDPFGSSRMTGVPSMTQKAAGITSAAGPLFNLALGLSCSLVLWRGRHPALLPCVLWGPVAMVQEGVTFSLGLLTPGGDAEWVARLGVPTPILLASGILLLLGGVAATSRLLSRMVFARDDPFWARCLIVFAGTAALMTIRAIHSLWAAPGSVVENVIPLAFSLLLTVVVAALHKPLTSIGKQGVDRPHLIKWPAVVSTIALGCGVFLLQIVASRWL